MHAGLVVLGLVCVLAAWLFLDVALQAGAFGASFQLALGFFIALVVTLVILVFLLYKVYRASSLKVKTGKEALIGAKGLAVSDLKPKGTVRVMSEFWQAVAKDGKIANGTEVDVIGMDGLFLVVEACVEKA
jgi:membrane-bound ClpP family serine protease